MSNSKHHDHDHSHDHDHGGHGHAHHHHGPGGHAHGVTDERRLMRAFIIIAVFMVVEIAGGIWSGSLALLADAGHMASDAAALAFSWLAIRIGKRAATEQLSYGFRRVEILAAFVNGLALFAIAVWIVIEAARRWFEPGPILGGPMLAVAVAGLAANIAAFFVLFRGSQDNLNLRSAMLHIVGDLLGSVAAIVAALVILGTGWTPIDPILSVLVAVIILKSAWGVVRSAGHILLEGTPPGVSIPEIKDDLERHVSVVHDVHHIHVWSITADAHLLTLHVVPREGAAAQAVIGAVRARLAERFGIEHATIQVEESPCADLPGDRAACC
ncbi:cation transporter [Pusillimonas caeni]|uniref:cation diffusion facilitator family transporter n=1 Tax=Pusillimonas caeni TaxID=1348472 RepID=UPI000E59AE2B|nr:cation diffusion facilitator family transporter [Pusillimonas caeni]TFL08445.1 cation transporter [Pusillimonas caeni]